MRVHHRQSEALAWRAVAELIRRHPEFEEIEFFWRIPGAGPPGYFALRFLARGRWFYIGLSPIDGIGSVTRERIDLSIKLLAHFTDMRAWATSVEQTFELNSPGSTPATSQAAIGFRLVADLLHRRLCERPFATAMPANLSNSSGTSYEHPDYRSVLRSLWGEDASYGYETFLWHVLSARPIKTDQGRGPEWDTILSGDGEHASEDDGLESTWDNELQQVAGAAAPTWVAPQRGLALNTFGETVDLLDLYESNSRSVTRTSIALFG